MNEIFFLFQLPLMTIIGAVFVRFIEACHDAQREENEARAAARHRGSAPDIRK